MNTLRILGLSLLPLLSGCVVVSMHTSRPVEVNVRQGKTGKPVAHATVKVDYLTRTGYGVFYILRIPKPVTGRTDASGSTTLSLADFGMGATVIRVNGKSFVADPDTIRHGGQAVGGHWKEWPTPPRPKPGEPPPQYVNIDMKGIWEKAKRDTSRVVWVTPVWIPDPVEVRLTPKK